MTAPIKLSMYLIQRFTLWMLVTGAAFSLLIFLGDFLDMLKLASKFNQGSLQAAYFTLLRFPFLLIDLMPFVTLFATVLCLLSLSESRELVVIRAAGVSVWQFILPLLAFTLLLGCVVLAFLDPIGTSSYKKFRQIENQLRPNMPALDISQSGLWLRETGPAGDRILHATRVVDETRLLLEQTNYMIYDQLGNLDRRVSAQIARLENQQWIFENAKVHKVTGDVTTHELLQLSTASQITNLQEHFRHPNTLSVWSLPQYISAAGVAGIDIKSHLVRLYSMLALPFMLTAMVLVAASFSVPTGRILSTGRTIGFAILFGFLLFIFGKFVAKLSELSILPIFLASLAPPLIATLLALTLLLEAEDG